MFTEITSFCRGAPGAAIVGHRVEHLLRDVGTQGGGENQISHPKGWLRGVWDKSFLEVLLEGQEAAGLGVEFSQGPSPSELFQPGSPFSSYKALLLLSVSLHPADSVWALLPSHPELLWCKFPIFQPTYYNLCVLSLCCQVLLEILVICKDLFKAVLSEAWKKFSHNLPSWIHNKHLYHLLNS